VLPALPALLAGVALLNSWSLAWEKHLDTSLLDYLYRHNEKHSFICLPSHKIMDRIYAGFRNPVLQYGGSAESGNSARTVYIVCVALAVSILSPTLTSLVI
jgi:hypothetical protein